MLFAIKLSWSLIFVYIIILPKFFTPSIFRLLQKRSCLKRDYLLNITIFGGVVKLASQRSPKPSFQVQVLAPPLLPAIALRDGGFHPSCVKIASFSGQSPLLTWRLNGINSWIFCLLNFAYAKFRRQANYQKIRVADFFICSSLINSYLINYFFASLCLVCLRQVLQNFDNSSLPSIVLDLWLR